MLWNWAKHRDYVAEPVVDAGAVTFRLFGYKQTILLPASVTFCAIVETEHRVYLFPSYKFVCHIGNLSFDGKAGRLTRKLASTVANVGLCGGGCLASQTATYRTQAAGKVGSLRGVEL